MATPSSPTVLKRWIALELRRLREEADVSRQDAANRLGQNRSNIGHFETAYSLPSPLAVEALLELYGASERIPSFLDLVATARRGKDWWAKLAGAAPSWFNLYLGLEAGAAEISSFDTYLVPGLLQTPDYATAVISADPEISETQLKQRVELRMARQQVLGRSPEPLRLWSVLDESVLYRRRGTPEVMAAQLASLLEMSEQPRVDIQVLPLTAGAHLAQHGTFQILKFPDDMIGDPGVIYIEELVEGRYFEEPTQIALYERTMARLRVLAAPPDASRRLIEQAMRKAEE